MIDGLSLRMPPANPQAEQALLGAILANNKAYDYVSGFLRPDHFADPVHGKLFERIGLRIDSGRLADTLSLKAELEHDGVLATAGGLSYLAQLLSAMVSPTYVAEYGRAIQDSWHRRQLIEIGEELVRRAFGRGEAETAKDIHESAEAKLFELADRGGDVPMQAHVAMSLAIDAAEKASQRPSGLVGITTGLRELDEMTGGLRAGTLNLLAARPSMGKTTLALSIAVNAVLAGARVLFVSREMTQIDIGACLAGGMAPVHRDLADRGRHRERDEYGRFRYRPINDVEIHAMMAAQRAMVNRDLVIDECRAGTISAIRSGARRMKRRGGLDLIIVDYLGLLKIPEMARSDNRVLEVTRLSADSKAMAVDLNVPVLMLAQLNRGPESREDKRPSLADLRDSGSLEQDADVVMFLYREHYYLTRNEPKRNLGETEEHFSNRVFTWHEASAANKGLADVIFAKQRKGPTGIRRIAFHDENIWFSDADSNGSDS
jgi:replicative DNA helicase